MYINRSVDMLKTFEGFSGKLYRCTTGAQTIGYGFNVDAGMSERAAASLLEHQVTELYADLARFEFFDELDEVRQSVIVQMAFQMGSSGLLKFRMMLEAIKQKDYAKASIEMLNSKWANQTPMRAKKMAAMMKAGLWEI